MKLNKPLIRKMIKRLETNPESYEQSTYLTEIDERAAREIFNRPAPRCGSVQCLGGDAIICAERSVRRGLEALNRLVNMPGKADFYHVRDRAQELTGLPANIFHATADGWPAPFERQWRKAATYKGQSRAAINLLRA